MNSGADLDRLLKSPVGLAHRSSGGIKYAGKQKYKNKQQAEELFEVWHLDIWATNIGRVLTKPCTLDTSRDGWVKAISSPGDGVKPSGDARLKFRALLTRPPQDGKYPWPKYHDQGDPGYKQIHFLPFLERDMKALLLGWQLPIDWLYLRPYAKGCGNYIRKTTWNEQTGVPEQIAFVVHFPYVLSPSRHFTPKEHEKDPRRWDKIVRTANTRKKAEEKLEVEEKFRNGDPFIWSVCLSHHIQNGTTKALFDGFTDRMTEDLCERLEARSCFWSEHPLYLLIVLLDIYVGCTTAHAKDVDYTYHKLDGSRIVKFEAISLLGSNLSSLVVVERMLDFNLQLATFLIDTLAYLEKDCIILNKMSPCSSDNKVPSFQHLINNDRDGYIKLVNRQMKESLTNTIEFLKNQIHFIGGLQKRNGNDLGVLQANLGRIVNEYNQEISEDSRALAYDAKQDSTSMMTVSILTMAFLPATAVAAICSMSVFDWSQPQGVVVSPHFWIFWAVVLPLTFALMAGWFAWYFLYRKPKMDLERKKMECQACSEARSEARVVRSDLLCKEHRDEFSCWKYWRHKFSASSRKRAEKEYLL